MDDTKTTIKKAVFTSILDGFQEKNNDVDKRRRGI
jgi:hypothetical protein